MYQPKHLNCFALHTVACLLAVTAARRPAEAQVFKTLYTFTGGTDGGAPWGSPLLYNGNIFGTTYYGGGPSSVNVGTVFELYPSAGIEAPYYVFAGEPNDGAYPMGGLAMDPFGDFFGTTTQGGSNLLGTIFEISGGSEFVVYNFSGPDGESPEGNLAINAIGDVYGTTSGGGANNSGTVFVFTTGGTLVQLHNFGSAPDDGIAPAGDLILFDDVLYGTTTGGGTYGWGTVFSLDLKTKTETVLFSFNGRAHGATPAGGLIPDGRGNVYGTTSAGGSALAPEGNGVVFKLNIGTKAYSVVHTFKGTDGSQPTGALTTGKGNLYGTTFAGGAYGYGTVFEVHPAGTFTLLHSFTNGTDGAYPYSGVILDSSGKLYGTATRGGANGWGTLFEIIPARTTAAGIE